MVKVKKSKSKLDRDFPRREMRDAQGEMSNPRRRINIHPLVYFAERKLIDLGQQHAGLLFFNAFITYSGQRNMAMDWSQERVDTSGRSEPFSASQAEAGQIIKQVQEVLGPDRYERFRLITGEGMFPVEVAREIDGHMSKSSAKRETDRWYESLTIVAREYGFVR